MNRFLKAALVLGALLLPGVCGATASWPNVVSSSATLYTAVNNCGTTLSLTVNASTPIITVANTSCFPSTGFITIDDEAISYTAKVGSTFTGCTRGADGTSAAAHSSAVSVDQFMLAAYHNALKDEIIAMSTYFLQGSVVHIDTTTSRLGIGTATPSSPLTVQGVIESTSGGIKFPDGTTQTTSASTVSLSTGSTTVGTGCPSTSVLTVDVSGKLACSTGVLFSNTTGQITGNLAVGTFIDNGTGIFTGSLQANSGFQSTGVLGSGLSIGSGIFVSTSTDGSGNNLLLDSSARLIFKSPTLPVMSLQPQSSTQTVLFGGLSAKTAVVDIEGSSTTGTVGIDIAGGNGNRVIDFWGEPTQVTLEGQIIGMSTNTLNGTPVNVSDFVLVAGQVLPNQPNNLRLFAGNQDVVDVSTGSVVINKPTNVTGTVTATTFSGSGASLTSLSDSGLSSNVPLKNGTNTFTGVNTFTAGSGGATYQAGGILDTLLTSSGTSASSAAEQTLYSYTISSNTLVSTATLKAQVIHMEGGGLTTTGATLEEVRAYFGATVIFDSGAGNFGTTKWNLNCDIIQRGTGASQWASCSFTSGTASLVNTSLAATETITSNIVVKITGQVQVATLNGVEVDAAYVEKK